jgi:hypothetical protein
LPRGWAPLDAPRCAPQPHLQPQKVSCAQTPIGCESTPIGCESVTPACVSRFLRRRPVRTGRLRRGRTGQSLCAFWQVSHALAFALLLSLAFSCSLLFSLVLSCSLLLSLALSCSLLLSPALSCFLLFSLVLSCSLLFSLVLSCSLLLSLALSCSLLLSPALSCFLLFSLVLSCSLLFSLVLSCSLLLSLALSGSFLLSCSLVFLFSCSLVLLFSCSRSFPLLQTQDRPDTPMRLRPIPLPRPRAQAYHAESNDFATPAFASLLPAACSCADLAAAAHALLGLPPSEQSWVVVVRRPPAPAPRRHHEATRSARDLCACCTPRRGARGRSRPRKRAVPGGHGREPPRSGRWMTPRGSSRPRHSAACRWRRHARLLPLPPKDILRPKACTPDADLCSAPCEPSVRLSARGGGRLTRVAPRRLGSRTGSRCTWTGRARARVARGGRSKRCASASQYASLASRRGKRERLMSRNVPETAVCLTQEWSQVKL